MWWTKSIIETDELKNYLDGLSDATRADKEQMNQMASTNKAIVELRQHLIEAKNSTTKPNYRINFAGGEAHKVAN